MSIDSIIEAGITSPNSLVSLLFIIIYAVMILVIMSAFAYLFGWIERKVIAKSQYRHGPTYLGKYGLLQNMADLIKLISKEKVTPANAEKLLFSAMPQLLVAMTIFAILIIPFTPNIAVTNIGIGLLALFVLIAFSPIVLFLAGFASGNKFADISAQRSVLMLIGYELPVMIVIASIVVAANSYNLHSIVLQQSKEYFALLMPLGLFVFFVAMLAELERSPFDLREADSELIAGWLTDVSPPYYALALFIDYTRMFMGSLLIAVLFFGGWLGPLMPPILWLLAKAFIISLIIIVIRVSVVRMRIDRILRFGWFWLIPLSLINLVITYVIVR